MMVEQSEIRHYLAELRSALTARGVVGDEADQVVAEVEAHVRDTGERPTDAFGDPRSYADAYGAPPAETAGPAPDRIPVWAKVVVVVLALMLAPYALMLLASPVLALAGGASLPELLVFLGLVAALAGLTWWAVRAYRRLPHPSTFGTWTVGLGVPLTAALLSILMMSAWFAMLTAGQGQEAGRELVLHPVELAIVAVPLVLLAVVVRVVVRAARAR